MIIVKEEMLREQLEILWDLYDEILEDILNKQDYCLKNKLPLEYDYRDSEFEDIKQQIMITEYQLDRFKTEDLPF